MANPESHKLNSRNVNVIRKLYIALSFMFFFNISLHGQIVIGGVVRDASSGEAMAGVNVMLRPVYGKGILKYCITRENGGYELSYTGELDSLMVAVTGFNIKPCSQTIRAKTQILDFLVEIAVLEIDEVIVKAREITRRSDTLSYNVASFADVSDRSIGDVIKKMPGIEVAKSGEISYQGKPINKFYIEDMDMLQGRYGIATNNVQAKDIAAVQVYENHQPVRALQDVQSSESAALNLKLKDKAKGTFNAVIQAGIGYEPLLWNGEFIPMYFTGSFQTIGSYKTNNTGEDVSMELKAHYGADEYTGSMLRVALPSPPPLDKERYLDNNIHALSVNTITKLAEQTTFSANASYLHDEQAGRGRSETTYFFPDQPSLLITEAIRNSTLRDHTAASIQVETNKDRFYLREKFSFAGQWDGSRSNVRNEEEEIFQKLDDRNISFDNDLMLTKVIGRNRINATSRTSYSEQPSSLIVTPLLYDDLFGDGAFAGAHQDLSTRQFKSVNNLYMGRNSGKWYLFLGTGVDIHANDMESSLFPYSAGNRKREPADTMRNDIRYNRLDLKLGPNASYNARRFRVNLYLPVNYTIIDIRDRVAENNDHGKKAFSFSPSVNFTLELRYNFKMTGNASFNTNYTGEDNYSGFIMTDYRTIGNRKGEIKESRLQNYGLSLNYGNALKSIFASADARYWKTASNLMYGTWFSGILSWIELFPIHNSSSGYMFGGKISKRFQNIATTVGLSGQYILSYSDVLRQNEILNTRGDIYNAGINLVTRFSRAVRIDYDLSWMRSATSLRSGEAAGDPIDVLRQGATITFFISKSVILKLSGEHYYNSLVSGGDRNMLFADAGLNYKAKRVEYIIDVRNIFGKGTYDSASYGDMVSFVNSYHLRPRSIMLKIRFSLK